MIAFFQGNSRIKALAFALGIVFVAPFVVVGDSTGSVNTLYVDQNASEKQNGTKDYPFETISQAINIVEDNDGTKIYVAQGEYKENFNIPEDAQVIGAGKDKTIIKGDDEEPVVYMEHGTKLQGVTVQDGEVGILVKKNSRAEISSVIVKDNDKEGILALEAHDKGNRYALTVSDTIIKDNGRSGVYSEKRSVVIVDSSLYENNWNGVAVSKDSKLWLEDSKIYDNEKSGVHITLDESDIFVIDCDIEDNKREGLEMNVFVKGGYAKIDNNNFVDNGRYGIVRLNRSLQGESVWKDVIIKMNSFDGNELGTISPIMHL